MAAMKKIILTAFIFSALISSAQVGWGDRIKTPREKFAVQKIWDAEKTLKLKTFKKHKN